MNEDANTMNINDYNEWRYKYNKYISMIIMKWKYNEYQRIQWMGIYIQWITMITMNEDLNTMKNNDYNEWGYKYNK